MDIALENWHLGLLIWLIITSFLYPHLVKRMKSCRFACVLEWPQRGYVVIFIFLALESKERQSKCFLLSEYGSWTQILCIPWLVYFIIDQIVLPLRKKTWKTKYCISYSILTFFLLHLWFFPCHSCILILQTSLSLTFHKRIFSVSEKHPSLLIGEVQIWWMECSMHETLVGSVVIGQGVRV